jgi:transcriptional regulator
MHTTKQFRRDDVESIRSLVAANPLGTLVINVRGDIVGNHIPFLWVDNQCDGTLEGHVARANPVWRDVTPDSEVLVVFSGADAYISPSWYPSKARDERVVPTWNYSAVHIYGHLQAIDEPDWLKAHVTKLTDRQEANFAEPWSVADAPPDFTNALVNAIVGLQITVTRIEGKWKFSQNRNDEDRAGVVAGLSLQNDSNARSMAREIAAMAASFDK